jgi:transaldolase
MALLIDPEVKIFADGADLASVRELCTDPLIAGFTTNPTLIRQAGVTDYETFARQVLEAIDGRPVSFEVLSDEFDEMERQALKIASWGTNVYVKIPITNTRGDSSAKLIRTLSEQDVNVNVTAIMTDEQLRTAVDSLVDGLAGYVSVFAGRIADSGRHPLPIMRSAVSLLRPHEQLELIWASPREILNVVQAAEIGCDIITVTHDLLKKLPLLGRDLDQFSLDTVEMFYRDAVAAGLSL